LLLNWNSGNPFQNNSSLIEWATSIGSPDASSGRTLLKRLEKIIPSGSLDLKKGGASACLLIVKKIAPGRTLEISLAFG